MSPLSPTASLFSKRLLVFFLRIRFVNRAARFCVVEKLGEVAERHGAEGAPVENAPQKGAEIVLVLLSRQQQNTPTMRTLVRRRKHRPTVSPTVYSFLYRYTGN
jgi:hypothetical protein